MRKSLLRDSSEVVRVQMGCRLEAQVSRCARKFYSRNSATTVCCTVSRFMLKSPSPRAVACKCADETKQQRRVARTMAMAMVVGS
jgi:hypothetical protein